MSMKLRRNLPTRTPLLLSIFLATAALCLSPFDAHPGCVSPPAGLVGWWQGEGNATDSTGKNPGTLQGNVTFGNGEVGQAFNLNGNNGYIRVADSPTIDVGAGGGFTVELWINPNDLAARPLVEWNSNGSFGPHFWMSQPPPYGTGVGCLYANIRDNQNGDHYLYSTNGLVISNSFQHVALTYDSLSGVARLYYNGTNAAEQNLGTFTPQTTYPVFFGARPLGPASGLFSGLIDELGLYNRSLDPVEIQGIYAAGSAGKCGGPPSILAQPSDLTVAVGTMAVFSVQASGSQPMAYQWQFNGGILVGATNSTFVIPFVQTTNAGGYSVTVQNADGSQVSSEAYLTVVEPPPCVAAPAGLVSWWQGEYSAADGWGTNHGTLSSGVTFGSGMVGRGFQYSGNNSYLQVGSLNVGTNTGMTIEWWMNPSDMDTRPLVEWNSGGTFGVHIWMSQPPPYGTGSGSLYANVRDTGGGDHYLYSPAGLLQANTFQHVTFTYDRTSGTANFYLNGAQVAQTNLGSYVPQTSFPLFLGCRPAGLPVSYYSGFLDEVSVYGRALSASEVQAIYAAQAGGKCGLAPSFLSQPASRNVAAGSTVVLSAVATGSQPLNYQWLLNGTNLFGATTSALVLSNVQSAAAGAYSAFIQNQFGSQQSSNALLSVYVPVCVNGASNLVSWWQGEGNASDALGLNPGAIQGPVAFSQGKVGQAFKFNGTSSFASVAASTNFAVATNTGLTIECWLNPSDLNNRPVLEWNSNGTFGVHFWLSQPTPYGTGSGCLYANLRDSQGANHYLASPPGVLSSGAFQHVALTYDADSGLGRFYLNGGMVSEQNLGTFIPRTSYPLYLGARPVGSGLAYFNGLIDELDIYNRALSPDEIQAIYAADNAGKCPLPLSIISQPAAQTATVGNIATLSILAAGTQPLGYRWQLNGADLPGATDSKLVLTNVQPNTAGAYAVIITNCLSVLTSAPAALTINPPVSASYPTGLVSWWSAEGDFTDRAGTNNGTGHGTYSFVSGKVGQAVSFNGANVDMLVPASATSNVGTNGGLTLDFWVNPADLQARPLIEWNTTSIQVSLWSSTTVASGGGGPGCLYASLRDASSDHVIATGPGLLMSNCFQHVGLTYDKASGIAALYLNGVKVVQKTLGSFTPLTTANLYFGYRPSGVLSGTRFKGQLDEVELFSRALSAQEIQAIYDASSAGRSPGPTIFVQPQGCLTYAGSNVTFSVLAAGARPLTYQWQWNGTNLAGATRSMLTLTNVQPSSAGSYSVLVSNAAGFLSSAIAPLRVNIAMLFGNGLLLTNAQYVFGASATISLQSAYTNGYLFYTLDGREPTYMSDLYSAPLVITNNCILRVLAYSPDFLQSNLSDPITILIYPVFNLTAATAGGGTVLPSPATGPYVSNSVITLTAIPASGWTFIRWQGDLDGANPTNTIVMDTDKSVQAVFGTSLAMTVAGKGAVTLNPLQAIYPYGAVVQVTAIPQVGNYFAFWGNAGSGSLNPLLFTVSNTTPTISALFGALPAGQASLAVVPAGHGRVSLAPQANLFTIGQTVTITATPDAGQSFLGWSGDASGTQNPLSISMDQSKVIYANFSRESLLTCHLGASGISAGIQLLFNGGYGIAYRLDASSNLVDWGTLGSITNTNSLGPIQLMDYNATNFSRRFYRAVGP